MNKTFSLSVYSHFFIAIFKINSYQSISIALKLNFAVQFNDN